MFAIKKVKGSTDTVYPNSILQTSFQINFDAAAFFQVLLTNLQDNTKETKKLQAFGCNCDLKISGSNSAGKAQAMLEL